MSDPMREITAEEALFQLTAFGSCLKMEREGSGPIYYDIRDLVVEASKPQDQPNTD